MSEPISAIYEHGVLRPLMPLGLPERTRVEIRITITPLAPGDERHRVREAC